MVVNYLRVSSKSVAFILDGDWVLLTLSPLRRPRTDVRRRSRTSPCFQQLSCPIHCFPCVLRSTVRTSGSIAVMAFRGLSITRGRVVVLMTSGRYRHFEHLKKAYNQRSRHCEGESMLGKNRRVRPACRIRVRQSARRELPQNEDSLVVFTGWMKEPGPGSKYSS